MKNSILNLTTIKRFISSTIRPVQQVSSTTTTTTTTLRQQQQQPYTNNRLIIVTSPQQQNSRFTMATPSAASFSQMSNDLSTLSSYDPRQVDLMNEVCIVVDENDNVIGSESKKLCHLMENINKGLLHRAFSVMIFNSKNEFLLTQRSDEKITFPGYYTNTCCSHPLYNELEMETNDALGVKRAAQRRLHLELGIDPLQVPLTDIKFMTKFLYKAPSNGLWGEHEIDYALVVHKDVTLKPDPNEVKSYRFISKEDLLPYLESEEKKGYPVTPWFKLMLDKFFFKWWDNLDDLEKFCEPQKLYRLS